MWSCAARCRVRAAPTDLGENPSRRAQAQEGKVRAVGSSCCPLKTFHAVLDHVRRRDRLRGFIQRLHAPERDVRGCSPATPGVEKHGSHECRSVFRASFYTPARHDLWKCLEKVAGASRSRPLSRRLAKRAFPSKRAEGGAAARLSYLILSSTHGSGSSSRSSAKVVQDLSPSSIPTADRSMRCGASSSSQRSA